MVLVDKENGEVVRIECGIVPTNKDVTQLAAEDKKRASDGFPYFYKMPEGGTDFDTELALAPSDCPFKSQQFGKAALGVCIECPQRIVELVDGTLIF